MYKEFNRSTNWCFDVSYIFAILCMLISPFVLVLTVTNMLFMELKNSKKSCKAVNKAELQNAEKITPYSKSSL